MKCCRTWRCCSTTQVSLGNGARSEIVLGSLVSANYFDALGVSPPWGGRSCPRKQYARRASGRSSEPRFLAKSVSTGVPELVGQTIVLNNKRFTVTSALRLPGSMGRPLR